MAAVMVSVGGDPKELIWEEEMMPTCECCW